MAQFQKVKNGLVNVILFLWTFIYHGLVFFTMMVAATFGARIISFSSYDNLRIPPISKYYFDVIMTIVLFAFFVAQVIERLEKNNDEYTLQCDLTHDDDKDDEDHRVARTSVGILICVAYFLGLGIGLVINSLHDRLLVPLSQTVKNVSSPIESFMTLMVDLDLESEKDFLIQNGAGGVKFCGQMCRTQLELITGILFTVYVIVRSFKHLQPKVVRTEGNGEVHTRDFEQFVCSIIISWQENTWKVSRIVFYSLAFWYELIQSLCFVVSPLIIAFYFFHDTREYTVYLFSTIIFCLCMALLVVAAEVAFSPSSLKNFLLNRVECRFLASFCLLYLALIAPLILFYNTGHFSNLGTFWLDQPNVQYTLSITSVAYCCYGIGKILISNYIFSTLATQHYAQFQTLISSHNRTEKGSYYYPQLFSRGGGQQPFRMPKMDHPLVFPHVQYDKLVTWPASPA